MKTYKVSWVEYTERSIEVVCLCEEDAFTKAFAEYDYGSDSQEPLVDNESLEIKEVQA